MPRSRFALAAVVAAVAAAITVVTGVLVAPAALATPILGGSADGSDTAIGLVTAGSASCSGMLITPTRVLTAAHCVATGAIAVSLDDGD
jgi:hypothetical protein